MSPKKTRKFLLGWQILTNWVGKYWQIGLANIGKLGWQIFV